MGEELANVTDRSIIRISIYVLDLCIIKGNKVKFQEKLLFREGSRFF